MGIRFRHIQQGLSLRGRRDLMGLVVTEKDVTVEKVKFKICRRVRLLRRYRLLCFQDVDTCQNLSDENPEACVVRNWRHRLRC